MRKFGDNLRRASIGESKSFSKEKVSRFESRIQIDCLYVRGYRISGFSAHEFRSAQAQINSRRLGKTLLGSLEDRFRGIIILMQEKLCTEVEGKLVITGIYTHRFLVMIQRIPKTILRLADVAKEVMHIARIPDREGVLGGIQRAICIFEMLEPENCQIVVGLIGFGIRGDGFV